MSRTKELFQHLVEPATAVNMVVFRAFGLLKGCVTLRGDFEVQTFAGAYLVGTILLSRAGSSGG